MLPRDVATRLRRATVLAAAISVAASLASCESSRSFGGSPGSGGEGPVKMPGQEICGNGLDDNGNGDIDEGCSCTVGATEPCYPGDPSQLGVGICAAGVQTCLSSGIGVTGWGLCEGAVLPATEICDDLDNDCDGHVDCPGCATSGDCSGGDTTSGGGQASGGGQGGGTGGAGGSVSGSGGSNSVSSTGSGLCLSLGDSCEQDQCCSPYWCLGQRCCVPNDGDCSSAQDCCGINQDCSIFGKCCVVVNKACNTNDNCCGSHVCKNGTCQNPA